MNEVQLRQGCRVLVVCPNHPIAQGGTGVVYSRIPPKHSYPTRAFFGMVATDEGEFLIEVAGPLADYMIRDRKYAPKVVLRHARRSRMPRATAREAKKYRAQAKDWFKDAIEKADDDPEHREYLEGLLATTAEEEARNLSHRVGPRHTSGSLLVIVRAEETVFFLCPDCRENANPCRSSIAEVEARA